MINTSVAHTFLALKKKSGEQNMNKKVSSNTQPKTNLQSTNSDIHPTSATKNTVKKPKKKKNNKKTKTKVIHYIHYSNYIFYLIFRFSSVVTLW